MLSKKIILGLAAGLLLPFSLFAKDLNIAFVDGQEIVQRYQNEIDGKISGEFEKKRNEIIALQTDLKEKTDKLTRDEAILSDSEVKKIKDSVSNKQRELQRLSTAYQEDYNIRGQQELQKLGEKLQDVIDGVAKEKHFDIVLQRGAAIFVDNSYDITKEVLEKLEKHKVS